MDRPHASQITRIDMADGAEFHLPPRPLGLARLLGLPFIAFSCLFSGFAVYWIISVFNITSGPWSDQEHISWFIIPFAACGVPFAIAGLAPALMGLIVLCGRNRIVIRNDRLICTECVGPLSWSRKRSLHKIAQFEVPSKSITTHRNNYDRDDLSDKITSFANLTTLQATGDSMKKLVVAWGYPTNMLLDLATELANRCDARIPAPLLKGRGQRIGIVEPSHTPPEESHSDIETAPNQPAESPIIVDHHDGGVTLNIPPAGIRAGSKGLFVFGLIWCGFMSIVTTMVFVLDSGLKGGMFIVSCMFIAAFWAIGGSMLVGAINMGRRRAILDIVAGANGPTLLITRQNIFGTRQQDLHRNQITAIRVGNSGMEVNNVPVKNLHIYPRQGKTIGLFSGRDNQELRWLAAMLRQGLGVGSSH